jgi:hypothetical protein
MLFLGVDISTYCIELTALSQGFAFPGERSFPVDERQQLSRWVCSLLLEDYEPVSWFFCESQFYESDFYSRSFPQFGSHSYFLVKDRLVLNFYHVCNALRTARCASSLFSKSLVLAASRKLFDSKFICQFTEESPLPLWIK